MEIRYKKLTNFNTLIDNEKCGYIIINAKSLVPYCIIDGQKYIPLLFFNINKLLIDSVVRIENWNFAY